MPAPTPSGSPSTGARPGDADRSPRLSWAHAKAQDLFGADLRSLAALRIGLALVVLVDLAGRASDLTAHYTDGGVLPRAVLLAHTNLLSDWTFSVNLISGAGFVQAILFGIAALAAVALLVGYCTRLVTLIVWLLVVSIQWRNPLLLGGGETLLRVLLFWGMFLPLGAVWSIDRARGRTPEPSSLRVLSVPTAALFLQIAFVYWFAVLLKSGPEWRVHGTAIQYALSVDELARPLGTFLLHYPALLTVLTFGVLALEAFGPFLLFSPLFTGPVRTVAVALFMSFQLGIWLTLGMGIFPAVAGLCMVCFLPSWFWDRVGRRRRAGDGRSRTAARMAAGNGKPAATFRTSRAITVLTAVLLVYVFWWNIGTVSGLRMPEPVARLGQFLALAQIWDMFAPSPLMDDGWYIIPGTLQDGRTVDLAGVLTGDEGLRPVSGRRPSNIRATFKNERWRKYLENLRLRHVSQHLYLSRYICREWNHHHTGGQAVTRLLIVFEGDRTLLNGHRAPPEPRRLWTQVCP